jgi:hypothetical protein
MGLFTHFNADVTPRQFCAGLNSALLDSGDPVMTTSAKLAGVALLSSLVLAAAPVSADDATGYRVTPLKGITLTVGSKRAVSYYTVNADNACNLTLLLADAYSETDKAVSEPVRVNLTVRQGTTARVDTLGGSLAFACAAGATAMTIQPIERVAYNAAAK